MGHRRERAGHITLAAYQTPRIRCHLNDTLHIGPKIQDDLLHILLRFRIHRYVITGDIEKMYRQFIVRPEDRKYQRILWRDRDGTIKTFQLNTVTFGLSAAPYLAIRSLTQLARDEAHRFPLASEILQRDFYVDDALTGTATKKEALALREDITQLLKSARLNVRQWASNDRDLLQGLSEFDVNRKLHLGESSTLKTLGIVWNSATDFIHYAVKTTTSTPQITKRHISSEIARIYNPLGLLGPVIIIAKLLLQQIWILKADWDESLPMDIHTQWTQYYTQLPLLNNATFNRKTIINAASKIQLHGFYDASEKAYGACVYLRSIDACSNVQVNLLLSKSKVAPLRKHSLPRLELCGALLLVTLITIVRTALHIDISNIFLWSDSTIVLHWINTSPHVLKTFVANRVAEIQRKIEDAQWRHVGTSENPADLISCGQSPEEFLQPSIWQHGPTWLSKEEIYWPLWILTPMDDIPEQKTTICLASTLIDYSILERYSSWGKLIRIIAYCLRWKHRHRSGGCLTVAERNYAHNTIIKMLQHQYFAKDIHHLSDDKKPEVNRKLRPLNPFTDQNGILRVGGRLKHSFMPFSQKHPIILPKAHLTTKIIEHEHRTQLHAGVQTTLYAIRRCYWPIDGRSQVWSVLKKCVRCCRANPPPVEYIMGNLPAARITESRPFTHVGVDYCGPFYIKEKRHRNRKQIKVYVAVFICLAVKAVHLELVSDITSEAFLAALRRFISRRGFCAHIYSDNDTNFTGANNELRELQKMLRAEEHQQSLTEFLTERSIQWHFIPPQTPHFGGLWEAAVKSFKYHLKRVANTVTFAFEDLYTLITEIEAILNSRPLTPISADSNDLLVLTPGHFLIGDSLTSLPEFDFREVPTNSLSNWQHIQKLKQHFWTRWHREYLNELTNRSKWTSGGHKIKEGSIVLLREDHVPSMHWPLGRVVRTHPGPDGIVRTVTMKTATKELDRNVKRLVPLPCQSEGRDPTSPASMDQPASTGQPASSDEPIPGDLPTFTAISAAKDQPIARH
ncbi:PREDICTED: uncharacterized protein LOC108577994 [Habropoda laboriosa]|uniref:uncharacterized protein LOC108577994 n=1 Tax=Habropoda laboriosa TaxID=597456 RepID=UPI00083D738D|nr:PREDICTED: uncharacterized protein LOC108577994 [Habropoda laboriosa]